VIRSSEFWGGLFWLAIGAFVVWAGRDLGLGRINDPGSGFALFWIGVLMVALASSVLMASLRVPGASLASLWSGTRWGKVLLVVALLVAFGFAFEPIGFIPCTLALLLILMLFVDPINPWVALTISLVAVLGTWATFTKALKIQLPSGVLAPWIG
jgi:putative tricarboxylic transport membrane protein